MAQSGPIVTMHAFPGAPATGSWAGLVQAAARFFGTSEADGASSHGTVFSITPAGTFASLHDFCQSTCADGGYPSAGLIQATNGYLFGTTREGGTRICKGASCGTVFKITPAGTFTSLHSLGGADGAFPNVAVIQASDGNLDGTTSGGGEYGPHVAVFRVTPEGSIATIYSFCSPGNCADGWSPGGLMQGSDGWLYGVTSSGGSYGGGTIFRMTTSGALTTL